MCTGRVDMGFVLRAFAKGADGVFIGGCHLGECNYTTHGNYYALRMAKLCRKVMERIGLDPERLSIRFISGGEGTRFAELMNEFSETIYGLGPLGKGTGATEDALTEAELASRLEAAAKLVPYVKLLERERFKVRFDTEAEFDEYFSSEEFSRLFDATIGEKLSTSRILALLGERPHSTTELAELLGMEPASVSTQMKITSRQGLVRFEESQNHYTLA